MLKNIATDPYYNRVANLWSRYFSTCDIQIVESMECINYIDKNLYGLYETFMIITDMTFSGRVC